jgi:Uma2 family endonuclease
VLDLALLTPERPRRITRAEYDRLVDEGFFDEERVELLRGVIIQMSPNNPPHASPVQLLTEALLPALVGRAHVRVQLPLAASDESEAEPDLAVVPVGDYSARHPDRALLVIEVALTSLRKDRLIKGPLYAASGFQEYWLFDVEAKAVEVHRGPAGDAWRSITRHAADETIHVEAFPDVTLRVGAVLP